MIPGVFHYQDAHRWHTITKNGNIKSNQIKSLLLSHHHSTSALVSEILESVLQTVQKKKQNNLHIDSTYLQTVQKTMCKIHIHILNTHSVLIKTYLVTNTPYVHILHYVHIYIVSRGSRGLMDSESDL